MTAGTKELGRGVRVPAKTSSHPRGTNKVGRSVRGEQYPVSNMAQMGYVSAWLSPFEYPREYKP